MEIRETDKQCSNYLEVNSFCIRGQKKQWIVCLTISDTHSLTPEGLFEATTGLKESSATGGVQQLP